MFLIPFMDGGEGRGEKRLNISNDLEKPREWILFTEGMGGWSEEGEDCRQEGFNGCKKPQPRLAGMCWVKHQLSLKTTFLFHRCSPSRGVWVFFVVIIMIFHGQGFPAEGY